MIKATCVLNISSDISIIKKYVTYNFQFEKYHLTLEVSAFNTPKYLIIHMLRKIGK